MKEYPNKEDHPGKGTVISTHWNDQAWMELHEFMKKHGIKKSSTAIKLAFFAGRKLLDTYLGNAYIDLRQPEKARKRKASQAARGDKSQQTPIEISPI